MTSEELEAIGKARHGETRWIPRFAQELGFARSTIWKAARGRTPVTREIENAVRLLPKKPKKLANQQQGSAHE